MSRRGLPVFLYGQFRYETGIEGPAASETMGLGSHKGPICDPLTHVDFRALPDISAYAKRTRHDRRPRTYASQPDPRRIQRRTRRDGPRGLWLESAGKQVAVAMILR